MIKIAISKPKLFLALKKYPIIRAFFSPRITAISSERDTIFSQYVSVIRGPSGVYMTTQEDRFDDLDPVTIGYMQQDFNCIHDVGVSTGVTTLALYRKLKAENIPFKLTISEKYARYLCSGNKVCRIYVGDKLVEGYVFGVLASEAVSWLFPLTRILFMLISMLKPAKTKEILSIYDQRIHDLLRRGVIEEIDYNIFSSQVSRTYTFVRCMNLLNIGYFEPNEIYRAVETLVKSLKDDGVLQIGRTNVKSGSNSVTYFQKKNDKLRVLMEINGGTEIRKHLADMLELPQESTTR